MRVFKSIDDRYLNSECLYKVKRLGVHLDYFQTHSGLKFDDFVGLCESPGFESFLSNYAPKQTGEPLPLSGLSCIDSHFKDFDLLMAFVHDGGRLEFLFNRNNVEADIKGLLKNLLSNSPQSFIIKSGLKPGEMANRMYVDFAREVIECFPDQIGSLLNSLGENEKDLLYINLVGIAACTGEVSLAQVPVNRPPSHNSVFRLAGLLNDGQKQTLYLCELRARCKQESSKEDLKKLLACTFMTETFRRCHETPNPEYILSCMRQRALAWSVLLQCPAERRSDFVDQLLASATCTSPKLFNGLGFSHQNLIGLNVNEDLSGLVKTVSDGPFALLIRADYDMSQTLNCLEFLHDVDENFYLNDIYDNSGFRHSNSIKILTSIGGHCPGAEYVVLNEPIEPENVLAILGMLSSLDCYDRYSEDCLVNLMSYYVDRLPTTGKDGLQQPLTCLEMTGDLRDRARLEFKRAYETNPAFKTKFIEKVETMEGLTHEHLRLFSLSGMDLPKTMTRTSRKDRGSLLSDELGL